MRDPYRGFGSSTILAGCMPLSELLLRCFGHVREGPKSVTPIEDAAPWCLSAALFQAAVASREGQNA